MLLLASVACARVSLSSQTARAQTLSQCATITDLRNNSCGQKCKIECDASFKRGIDALTCGTYMDPQGSSRHFQ
ncbi:hypothetical protein EDD22DRAFT_905908 [Suillus occidentalis]|nr:hypothetical protein EDD22DRAFT_905908 [Suillus occidentalis]